MPFGGASRSAARSGKIAASVLPPAVGASTTAFFPSRIASPASSCTGRSSVKPRWWAMACCSRSGKREKMLIRASHGHGGPTEVVVGRRRFQAPPVEDRRFLRGQRLGREAEQLARVQVGPVGEQIQYVDELAQELPRDHADVPPKTLGD